jgi:hypothetical protein
MSFLLGWDIHLNTVSQVSSVYVLHLIWETKFHTHITIQKMFQFLYFNLYVFRSQARRQKFWTEGEIAFPLLLLLPIVSVGQLIWEHAYSFTQTLWNYMQLVNWVLGFRSAIQNRKLRLAWRSCVVVRLWPTVRAKTLGLIFFIYVWGRS